MVWSLQGLLSNKTSRKLLLVPGMIFTLQTLSVLVSLQKFCMHLLWLEMFYHSVNMTIKLWPQAIHCLLSADDLIRIKAERREKYCNRWREMKKVEKGLCHVGRRWKERRGREQGAKKNLKKTKQAAPSRGAKKKYKRKSIAAKQIINSMGLCRGKTETDEEETFFLSQTKTVVYLIHACLNNMWHPFA